MTASRILSTLFQVRNGVKNRDGLMPATTFGLSRKANDEKVKAFQALYENHHRPVYRLYLLMTQNLGVAVDLTQKVFVQLFKKLKIALENADLNAQILHLAIDELLCYFLKDDEEFKRTENSPRPPPLSGKTQKQSAETVLDRAALKRAVAHLPIDYRLIFLLHDFERLTHREIARILKIDVKTSKLNLHEARFKLRRELINNQKLCN